MKEKTLKVYLDEVCDMLDTYGGRDKVMKILCYSAKLAAGLNVDKNPDLAKRFATISSKISGARATLRLIDDIPMLQHTLEYGLGSKESDTALSIIGVITNTVDHLFYPVEKICWLAEHKCLTVENPDRWDTISSIFWVSSIYLNLMRTCRCIILMEQHKHCLERADTPVQVTLAALLARQRMELISVIRLSVDLTHAVSTLPKGWFWGGKLKTWHVGALGTLSAMIGIYQYFAKKKLKKN
ncbi:peroxisomal membrane protein 11C [Contarinia nasturtii]|uniref:peroxisomal membrane protein 11C n=1 Tax=Contarinia nasturtii TaxID=265458 RepID=UPI0012D468E6|nr:peroxisomal membrane protein 11C [Contarinia nasturtii]XP_031620247.1 peroxisomal membrane protein 11C [Contarinia nasturtii]XP_031620248.1 peroxisomal membrane protein 11C [Contarinia nasturtii]